MTIVEVTNLILRYGDHVAVDGVSFTVEQGEIFGILGPNGAGKTTTVECLAGLRLPDSGTIRVLGRDPRHQLPDCASRLASSCNRASCLLRSRCGRRWICTARSTIARLTGTSSSTISGC